MYRKIIASLLLVLASVSQAETSGAIGLCGPDYALLYGVALDAGDSKLFVAPDSAFCGVSSWTDLLFFEHTGWGATTFTAPYRDIWVYSCISPYGVRELLMYSTPTPLLREGTDKPELGLGIEDAALADQLQEALKETIDGR